jgi:hypothetical protein
MKQHKLHANNGLGKIIDCMISKKFDLNNEA